jgi:hypothetical protein
VSFTMASCKTKQYIHQDCCSLICGTYDEHVHEE